MDSTKKTLPSKVFRGDSDDLVDALVEACQRPAPETLGPIVERDLVPYFGFCEPAEAVSSPATPPRRASLSKDGQKSSRSRVIVTGPLLGTNVTANNNKRKGSPPNLTRRDNACSTADKKTVRDMAATQPTPVQLRNNKASAAKPSSPIGKVGISFFADRSPVSVVTNTMSATTTPSGSPHFKCPGHFHSPKPEHLPMPTFNILARAHMHASPITCVAA